MTCVVAVVDDGGTVWMGADSAAVGGLSLSIRKDPKIYKVGDFMFGFTSSYRMGQILGYSFKPPQRKANQKCTDRYMRTDFIDGIRSALKDGGYARTKEGEEQGGTFLAAYEGRIFIVDSDFQVGEGIEEYNAVGCGQDLALGALYATSHVDGPSAEDRIITALEAASTFSAGVRGPYQIEFI